MAMRLLRISPPDDPGKMIRNDPQVDRLQIPRFSRYLKAIGDFLHAKDSDAARRDLDIWFREEREMSRSFARVVLSLVPELQACDLEALEGFGLSKERFAVFNDLGERHGYRLGLMGVIDALADHEDWEGCGRKGQPGIIALLEKMRRESSAGEFGKCATEVFDMVKMVGGARADGIIRYISLLPDFDLDTYELLTVEWAYPTEVDLRGELMGWSRAGEGTILMHNLRRRLKDAGSSSPTDETLATIWLAAMGVDQEMESLLIRTDSGIQGLGYADTVKAEAAKE